MGKRLFVFMKHGEKARTLIHFFAEKAMNLVNINKYTVENIQTL